MMKSMMISPTQATLPLMVNLTSIIKVNKVMTITMIIIMFMIVQNGQILNRTWATQTSGRMLDRTSVQTKAKTSRKTQISLSLDQQAGKVMVSIAIRKDRFLKCYTHLVKVIVGPIQDFLLV